MKKLRHVTLFDQTTRFRHVPLVGQTTRLKHAAWVGQTTRLRHVTLVIPCTALLLWRFLLALLPFGDIHCQCDPSPTQSLDLGCVHQNLCGACTTTILVQVSRLNQKLLPN